MKRIYLDYNATTPLCSEAAEAMRAAVTGVWGNPSSLHAEGQLARNAVERARALVAALVGVSERSILFTSGATEANNQIILGSSARRAGRPLVGATEHPSVRAACEAAAECGPAEADVGWDVVSVDENGEIALDAFAEQVGACERPLVSVMAVNNEVGVRYPTSELAAVCRDAGVPYHCDATQAVGRGPVDLAALGVDYASFSAHKLYGPKGVGALYAREPHTLSPLLLGGHQERARRPGTENLLAIIGFGAAAAVAIDLEAEAQRQAALRERLWQGLLEGCGPLARNGSTEHCAANTLNVSFLGCAAESLLIALDLAGVSVSAGSACSSGSLEPSPVIVAMTDDLDRQRSAIRFSLGRGTTGEEIEEAIERVARCVERVRK